MLKALKAWREGRRIRKAAKREEGKRKENLAKLEAAHAVIEGAGFYVCNIQHRAGANYLVDSEGVWHRVGKFKMVPKA